MRAVIFAGGLGTRLRPYTTVIPKPLVPVGDRPILEHILRGLSESGVHSVDLCVGHLGHLIRAYFSQATSLPPDLHLNWHWEDEPLGTAGALRAIDGLDSTFIAMNGDVLTNLDYRALLECHRARDAQLTIAMRTATVDLSLGVIESTDDLVTAYREKPTLRHDVSIGVYVYEPAALRLLPEGPCQFPDLVNRLLDAGQRVAAFRTDAAWYDIGTLEEHELASQAWVNHDQTFG